MIFKLLLWYHMKSLLKLLREYEDMFSKSSSDIGRTVVVKHNINTGFEPVIKQNLRRIPMHKKQEVKELLNDVTLSMKHS
jgi:hypothetical protein